ncbi:MAG: cell division protein FtsH, partial [Planctomycetes bacterium]|nr:cell division protein FtsH [Planctomycetota bacterium]
TKEETHLARKKLLGMVKLLYAGRIAEAIFCDDISSGASNDIERATELLRRMVCIWGMSDSLGPIKYEEDEDHVFLGREITRTRHHSDSTVARIDAEVQRISGECYEETKRLILENRDKVEKMAQALLRFETLDAEDVAILMKGGDAEAIQAAREVENLRRRGDEKPQELGAKNRERARGQAKTDDGGLQPRGEPAY